MAHSSTTIVWNGSGWTRATSSRRARVSSVYVSTRSAIDRFQSEMSVISQLRHPNIVECYEQGMTRGQFWFAMEYVAGTNLEALAKADSGRYPVNQSCRLTCQILKGLEQAHRLGF